MTYDSSNGSGSLRVYRGHEIARYRDPPGRSLAGGMEVELRAWVGILRRRATWIRAVFLFVFGAALVFTLTRTPVYRATALVEIRGAQEDISSIDALVEDRDPTEERLRTHLGLLRSSALATRVIDDLALDTHEEFSEGEEGGTQAIVDRFLERLVIDPVEESRLVRVSFDAGSPDLAAEIVNSVVDVYGELRAEARKGAARLLAMQADSVAARLREAEAELAQFADANDLPYLVGEDLATQLDGRLRDLRTRLAEAENTRYENESLYDVVVRQGRVEILQDGVLEELMLRLSELRREHARLSATFTDDYPETAEVARQIEHVRELIREEQQRLSSRVASDYRLALQREERIGGAIEQQEELANELGPQSGEYNVLRQAVAANRALYTTLHEKQRAAEIAAAVGATELVVVDPAVPPAQPHRPVFAISMALAAMLGLLLGVGVAFVRELLDDTVGTSEDVPIWSDFPVLAMIPALPSGETESSVVSAKGLLPWPGATTGRRDRWPRIDAVRRGDPEGNALSDAFGTLRTSVLFKDDGPVPRSILVTSCRAGEGKTTVSVNLAMSLARLGNRVLLVDADLRKPAVHRALGLVADPGLAHCLTNGSGWRDAVRYSVAEGLDVLPSGGATTRAGDLLSGERLRLLIRGAEKLYDFVIVDGPALFINAADAKVLSRAVDGVVAVVRSRSTPRALLDRIPDAVPNLIGVVVNRLHPASLPDYYGDYFAGYGESDAGEAPASDSSRR